MTMDVPRAIGHIVLNVTDVARSVEFYRDVIGFEVSRYQPGGNTAFLTCGKIHHDLALFKAPDGAKPYETGQVGLHHFAFEMESYEALQAAYQRLVEAEAKLEGIIDFGFIRTVSVVASKRLSAPPVPAAATVVSAVPSSRSSVVTIGPDPPRSMAASA